MRAGPPAAGREESPNRASEHQAAADRGRSGREKIHHSNRAMCTIGSCKCPLSISYINIIYIYMYMHKCVCVSRLNLFYDLLCLYTSFQGRRLVQISCSRPGTLQCETGDRRPGQRRHNSHQLEYSIVFYCSTLYQKIIKNHAMVG